MAGDEPAALVTVRFLDPYVVVLDLGQPGLELVQACPASLGPVGASGRRQF